MHTLLGDFSNIAQVQPSSLNCKEAGRPWRHQLPGLLGEVRGQGCSWASRSLVLALCSLDQGDASISPGAGRGMRNPFLPVGIWLCYSSDVPLPIGCPAQEPQGHTLWRAVSATSQATLTSLSTQRPSCSGPGLPQSCLRAFAPSCFPTQSELWDFSPVKLAWARVLIHCRCQGEVVWPFWRRVWKLFILFHWHIITL